MTIPSHRSGEITRCFQHRFAASPTHWCRAPGRVDLMGSHTDYKLDPVTKALLCPRTENHFVGVNCGILDQYTSCAGQEGCALLLDCRDLSSRPVRLVEGIQVVICDTKSKRQLANSEYGLRRAQCEDGARRLGLRALREISVEELHRREQELPAEVAKRCRFIVEEDQRVLGLAAALSAFDRAAIRELTAASFRGACELYEIGAPALHVMMQAMLAAPGVIGVRQAGAGFGGCMVAYVEKGSADAFAAFVRKSYFAATDTHPEVDLVKAAAGAGVMAQP